MTPEERNQFYEILMMINSSLELIINRAESIQKDCLDEYMYYTECKKRCLKNVKDILDMAYSIEKRKGPAFKMIEEQRKPLDEHGVDFSIRETRESTTREGIMKQWDKWHEYILGGGQSSWPRNAFESLLDFYDDKIEKQRKAKNIVVDKPVGNERPFPV